MATADASEHVTLIAGLCEMALRATRPGGLTMASVSRSLDARPAGLAYASHPAAAALEARQELLGEGPAFTALREAHPVFCADLGRQQHPASWIAFLGEAVELGIGSLWVLPLQIGAIGLGTFTLCGPGRADPDGDALGTALVVADALATLLLLPRLDPALLSASELADADHLVVHQATGMISVQLQVALEEAQLALRAAAYAEGCTLSSLARDVVDRRRRFDGRPL